MLNVYCNIIREKECFSNKKKKNTQRFNPSFKILFKLFEYSIDSGVGLSFGQYTSEEKTVQKNKTTYVCEDKL